MQYDWKSGTHACMVHFLENLYDLLALQLLRVTIPACAMSAKEKRLMHTLAILYRLGYCDPTNTECGCYIRIWSPTCTENGGDLHKRLYWKNAA